MERVEPATIVEQFGGDLSADEAQLWARRFLTLWHVADHGWVNLQGHGKPAADGYGGLPSSLEEAAELGVELSPLQPLAETVALEDLMVRGLAPHQQAALGLDDPSPVAFAVVFRFRAHSRDSVVLVFREDRVVRMFSVSM